MGEAESSGPNRVEVKSDDGAVHKASGDQVVLDPATPRSDFRCTPSKSHKI